MSKYTPETSPRSAITKLCETSLVDSFPSDIWLTILGNIHETPRQLFRRVSKWFVSAIPRKNYTQNTWTSNLYLYFSPESAYQYVLAQKLHTPAKILFCSYCHVDCDADLMMMLLAGKLRDVATLLLRDYIFNKSRDPVATDFVISADQKLYPGESSEERSARYQLLKASISDGNVALTKYFLITRKTQARIGLLEDIGTSMNLEIMMMLEKLWRFPGDSDKQTARLQVILGQVPRGSNHNSRAAAEFLVGLREMGLIDETTTIWKSTLYSDAWSLHKIMCTHGDYRGLRNSLAELGWEFSM